MPRNILEIYSARLATEVEVANESAKRAVALAVCKSAIESQIPDDPIVASAVRLLEGGAYGDHKLASTLQKHVGELDRAYFEAQQAKQDFLPLFAKARVANAVLFALNVDPFVAATHSLYEICAALGVEFVAAEVNRVLNAASGEN
jgi:hypothetical protein